MSGSRRPAVTRRWRAWPGVTAGVSAAEGTAEADHAMALIRKAVDMGYRDSEAFRTDWALDPIRDREDFKKTLAELEKTPPAKPK